MEWIAKVVLGSLFGAVNDFIEGRRRDSALVEKGALSIANQTMEEQLRNVTEKRNILRRLRNDAEYADSVRDAFRTG